MIKILAPLIALTFFVLVGIIIYRRRQQIRIKLAKIFEGDPKGGVVVKTSPSALGNDTVQNIITVQ